MNAQDFARAFPDYADFRIIPIPSGQKEVAVARRGDQQVAIKLFRKLAGDEDRIQRELAAVAKLKSEYVPAVYASGQIQIDGQDRYFLVERFIAGTTYQDLLRHTPVQPLAIVIDLASALLSACGDFTHQGLVHRDLKPGNLIRDEMGKLWVIDFGLVRHLDLSKITPTGYGLGTIGYAPLEQLHVIRGDVNVRADLFAVGVILYEALHGGNPWFEKARNPGDIYEVIDRMKTQELVPLRIEGDYEGNFSSFIAWLTQRFPSRRPQSAEEALEALVLIYRP